MTAKLAARRSKNLTEASHFNNSRRGDPASRPARTTAAEGFSTLRLIRGRPGEFTMTGLRRRRILTASELEGLQHFTGLARPTSSLKRRSVQNRGRGWILKTASRKREIMFATSGRQHALIVDLVEKTAGRIHAPRKGGGIKTLEGRRLGSAGFSRLLPLVTLRVAWTSYKDRLSPFRQKSWF